MNRTALRWTGYVAFAIAFAIACVYLSNWQFSRNDERERQIALIAANYDAVPVPLDDLVSAGPDGFAADDQWRPVELVGEYLTDDTLLARNRAHGGTSAFEVLVPFRTESGDVFLINRGWVPPGADQPEPDDIPTPPTGTVTVVARLSPGEPLRNETQSAPEGQVPTINLPLVARETGLTDLITNSYGLLVTESPAPVSSPTLLEAPSADPGPHLSYAIQWILFAVMGFVFIWYMIRTELRHRREDAEDTASAAAGSVSRPQVTVTASTRRRRGAARSKDRDMQDEDALLDELAPR